MNGTTLRFMFAPAGAIFFVLVAGAYYIKDVYDLRYFRDGLRFVIAALFAVGLPALVIEKGEKQIVKHKTNLLDAIGGPGYVVIQPGNAAMFRTLKHPSHVSLTSTYFMGPFETIAQTINLDEQQGDKDGIKAVTRDGIQVLVQDVHFRYQIKKQIENGQPKKRSIKDPYPFSDEAMHNVAFNLTVTKKGLDKWGASVEGRVVGAITEFISEHTIDYLTAPRQDGQNPRLELRNELFYRQIQRRLEGIGAELLWADVGHLDIIEESVDDQRTSVWAADWVGDANIIRAYGEAKRLAYQELGRAEAQAELIMSITEALNEAIQGPESTTNMRKLLLVRTAQVLDAMNGQNDHRGKT